jgi:hypothetical protein
VNDLGRWQRVTNALKLSDVNVLTLGRALLCFNGHTAGRSDHCGTNSIDGVDRHMIATESEADDKYRREEGHRECDPGPRRRVCRASVFASLGNLTLRHLGYSQIDDGFRGLGWRRFPVADAVKGLAAGDVTR